MLISCWQVGRLKEYIAKLEAGQEELRQRLQERQQEVEAAVAQTTTVREEAAMVRKERARATVEANVLRGVCKALVHQTSRRWQDGSLLGPPMAASATVSGEQMEVDQEELVELKRCFTACKVQLAVTEEKLALSLKELLRRNLLAWQSEVKGHVDKAFPMS